MTLDEVLIHQDIIVLSGTKSIIEVLKTGVILDRNLKITEQMLEDFVKNFNAGVYGTEVQVNLGHFREGEAAGWVKRLIKEGQRLLAEVEWTPLGVEKIQSKQYKFTSSELALSYPDAKTGNKVKNVFIGVALTNVPAVKGMEPVALSEDFTYSNLFLNTYFMKEKIKAMYDKLMGKDAISDKEMSAFDEVCKDATGDDAEGIPGMKKKLSAKVKAQKMAEQDGGDDEEDADEDDDSADEAKDGEEGKKDLNQKKVATVSLAEHNKLKKQVEADRAKTAKLQEELDKKNLSDEVKDELLLSEDVATGFKDEALDEVVDFMMGLSQEQRDAFKALMTKVQTVDLSTIGSTDRAVKVKTNEASTTALNEATAKAKKMSEESGRPLSECLTEVYHELDEAKL